MKGLPAVTQPDIRRKTLPILDARHTFKPTPTLPAPDTLADDHAERGVIGSVLQQPELFWSLSERLQATDFFYLKHRWIWMAFEQLTEAKEPIDTQTVGRWLDRQDGALKGDDALRLLADLYGAPAQIGNAEIYAGHVRESALRLRTIEAARAITALMSNLKQPVEQLVDESNRLLFEATDQHLGLADTTARAAAEEYFEIMQARVLNKERRGVAYGFPRFDDPSTFTGGMYPGDITVVCGHEGYGKTTFILSVARNVARAGKHVVMVTLEMRRDEIMQVFTSQETGIPKSTLRDGFLDMDQFDAMQTATQTVAGWHMHIIDEFRGMNNPLTPLALKRRLRVLLARTPVDLVIIDGLWLMQPDEQAERGGKERWYAVGQIMYGLADIAKGAAGVPVPVLITQQYRLDAYKADAPTLDLVAESAGVRRTAMVIVGLWRNENGKTEAHLLKDRAGGNGGHIDLFDYDRDHSVYWEKRL